MFDRKVWYITIVVIIAERFHLFPYRTQKLSFLTPKVLVGTLTGRIGHRHFPSFCRLFDKNNRKYCSLAQSVEHRTVNPSVVSSSLTGAAIFVVRKSYKTQKAQDLVGLVLFCCYILCFCCRTKSLKLTAAFWRFFEKQVLNWRHILFVW